VLCIGILVMWCGAAEPPRAPAVRCPPLVQYERQVQSAAAAELRGLPPGSAVARLVTDYGTLRARCRAISSR